MVQSRRAVAEGKPAHVGGQKHFGPGFVVVAIFNGPGKVAENNAYCFQCQGVQVLIGPVGDKRPGGVGKHVQSGIQGELRGQADGEGWIKNSQVGNYFVMDDLVVIGDHRNVGGLGAGSGSSRHCSKSRLFPESQGITVLRLADIGLR